MRLFTLSKARLSLPELTLFPTLNCGPSSGGILIYNQLLLLPPGKGNLQKGILLFSCLRFEFEKGAVHSRITFFSTFAFLAILLHASVDLQLNLAFDLDYLNNLTLWIVFKMVYRPSTLIVIIVIMNFYDAPNLSRHTTILGVYHSESFTN